MHTIQRMTTADHSIPVDSPGEYAQGLLDRLGDRDLIATLAATPAALRTLFDGLDDDAIRRPEAPGKWSMIEVAHHLADSDMVVGVRIRMIVAQDRPPIVAYDQDCGSKDFTIARPFSPTCSTSSLYCAMRTYAWRGQLTAEDLERYGIHTERGGESVGYLLRLVAGHDIVHLNQLARIRRAVS